MTKVNNKSIIFTITSKIYQAKGFVIDSFGISFGYQFFKLVQDLCENSR